MNATFPRALVEAFGREEILVAGAPELRIVDIGRRASPSPLWQSCIRR